MSLPPAPTVDDYDSDESAIIPGTRRHAGNHGPPTKPLMQHMRKSTRDAASDSGYSSHASNTVASSNSTHSQPTAGSQHLRQSSQPVNQNTIGRRESQRGQQRPSRSSSVCTNPHCDDPKCSSTQTSERGYTLPLRPQTQRSQTTQYPVQDPGPPLPHSQASNYPYPPHPAQPAPNYYHAQAEARPRAPSASQGRPTSWAPGAYAAYANPYQQGNPATQGNYGTGLPPSPSTYTRVPHMAQYPTTGADWHGMPPPMISSSPRDSFGTYMPGQPMPIPSNSQPYPPTSYSARQGNPATSSQEISIPANSYRQSTEPAISARRASSIMPGSYPGETQAFGSGSESSSESSDSEDDHGRQRHEQSRRRERSRRREQERDRTRRALEDRKAMPPPPRERERERRPTLTHTRTTPVDSRRHSREPPRRAPYSESDLTSSDYVDPDRTTRPGMSKRLTYSNSRELRRPAITLREPSGREKSSSLSHSSQTMRQYIVEDADGRKTYYDTREAAEYKASCLNLQQPLQQRENYAEAYMAHKRGNSQPATLTADNVKRAQTQQERKPASHASGSSKKSTVSSRTSATRTSTADSTIQIKRGDAVYTIPADRTVNIITKEGETMTIGPGSPPREKSYHGSSSGSTRMGRSRNGSEYGGRRRDTITEEHDGYESAL